MPGFDGDVTLQTVDMNGTQDSIQPLEIEKPTPAWAGIPDSSVSQTFALSALQIAKSVADFSISTVFQLPGLFFLEAINAGREIKKSWDTQAELEKAKSGETENLDGTKLNPETLTLLQKLIAYRQRAVISVLATLALFFVGVAAFAGYGIITALTPEIIAGVFLLKAASNLLLAGIEFYRAFKAPDWESKKEHLKEGGKYLGKAVLCVFGAAIAVVAAPFMKTPIGFAIGLAITSTVSAATGGFMGFSLWNLFKKKEEKKGEEPIVPVNAARNSHKPSLSSLSLDLDDNAHKDQTMLLTQEVSLDVTQQGQPNLKFTPSSATEISQYVQRNNVGDRSELTEEERLVLMNTTMDDEEAALAALAGHTGGGDASFLSIGDLTIDFDQKTFASPHRERGNSVISDWGSPITPAGSAVKQKPALNGGRLSVVPEGDGSGRESYSAPRNLGDLMAAVAAEDEMKPRSSRSHSGSSLGDNLLGFFRDTSGRPASPPATAQKVAAANDEKVDISDDSFTLS